jgi:hypothetical protein
VVGTVAHGLPAEQLGSQRGDSGVGVSGGGAAEAAEITRLSHDRHRREEADTADRLERAQHLDVRVASTAFQQRRIETANPFDGGADAGEMVIEGDLPKATALSHAWYLRDHARRTRAGAMIP